MNVAFIGSNPKNSYSGGRIHAYILAYAFAKLGYNIDYYTNNIPVFEKEFQNQGIDSGIHFIISKLFLWRKRDIQYKHIIIVPHLASRKSLVFDKFFFYPFVRKLKQKHNSYLWYIDFESSNWINEVDPSLRSLGAYRYSNAILKDCNLILSTTKTGKSYAEKYYSRYNKSLIFHQLYLAINTYMAETIDIKQIRNNSVVFFGRFGLKHKDPEAILNIIEALPVKYELIIIGNKHALKESLLNEIEYYCKIKEIKLSFYSNISEKVKFDILGKSKLLLFSTKFEGYGIPPLEAQYVGTNVLCSDLPVLREVNKYAYFTNFNNIEILKKDISFTLAHPRDPIILRKYIESFATMERFTYSLSKIISEIENTFD